jgi:hypothetical protein
MNPLEAQQADQARRQVNQIAEEIAQLSDQDLQPAQYYSEFLQRVYFALQGFAAAVWIRTPQGNLVLQCQINLREVGLDRTPEGKPLHDELLRQAVTQGKGGVIKPHYSHNFGAAPEQVAGNPTDYVILMVPILAEKQVIGLVELLTDPNRPANVVQNLYQFLVRMAAFVSLYQRNYQLRTMVGQQELWLKLETFSRQIHGSLDSTEVSYLIANEARRLIEVDRVSVAVRPAASCEVSAISGADVVEKRSNLVQLMRDLFDAVIAWGEKLVYTGIKDDALPPKVLHALDAYLGESNSKILVVMPLHDERDKESKKPARSALMMECFETNLQPDQLIARLDVVGRHACPSLYNAGQYRRIPFRFLWLPLAHVQDGLGGKTKAIVTASVAGVAAFILAMIFVPFPLKMDATGPLLPINRDWIFTPIPGKVEVIPPGLKSGSKVAKGQTLMELFDTDLFKQVNDLDMEIAVLEGQVNPAAKPGEAGDKPSDANQQANTARITLRNKIDFRNKLQKRTNAETGKTGYFKLVAPRSGIILNADFRENLLGKGVKPAEPLIYIGATDLDHPKISDWEIKLKIPQKHVGQVREALKRLPPGKALDVDVLIMTQPDAGSFRAKLHKEKIAQQAEVQKDDNNESEPMVIAFARIYPIDDDIPADQRIPPSLLLAGTEVHTRIRCGNHAMGYSLFYGVWEFLYEKVVFPFTP